MATTPRPYLWKSCTKRAENVEGVGGIAHYFTEDAQSFYLHNGIAAKNLYVDDGHWEDAVAGEEIGFETNHFIQMSLTHPATGSWYASVILPYENDQGVYLIRYTYARDMGHFITSAKWSMQVDNPISQLSATLKNYDSDAFTKAASLYVPGARAELGLTMGDSDVYKLGMVHLDEIDFKANSPTVSISGRNTTGYVLNDSTFNAKNKHSGTVKTVTKWILDLFGIEKYVIQDNSTAFELEYDASTTALKALQDICDRTSGVEQGTDWDIEEMWDGTLIIGFNSFRAQYLPKQVFKFTESDLFKKSSSKVIDGAYSKIYCTGKDSHGHDLTPVCLNVTTWKWWNVVPNKTYFPPTLENTTQAELAKYAAAMAKQIKRTGLTETYSTSIKPYLLVGDYATSVSGETETDIGIITQVNHMFTEKGYTTEFVADSGGDKQAILTRSANSTEGVYTAARRNSGDNRTKRLIDFIRSTAQQVVRTSSNSSSSSGVVDVEVDGTSVVNAQGVAEITMPTIPVVDVEVDGVSVVNEQGVAEIPAIGGATELNDLDDVEVSSPANGQVLKYDSTTQKFVNANESGGGGNVDDVKVNGTSVVDANHVAQIKSYKEVTQAQYDALPASKLSDDVLYAIKDATGAEGFPPLIYTDEEREVGVWYNGKPVYQKTFHYTETTVNTDVAKDISDLHIDEVIKVTGMFARLVSGYAPILYEFNSYESSTQFSWLRVDSADASILRWKIASEGTNKQVVTIQYTKSTDTAGEGNWATTGGYAHHYSENEQVVGTWIDGKTIYEKTFSCNTASNQTVDIDISALNVDTPLHIYMTGRCQLNGTDWVPGPGGYFQDASDGINAYVLSDKSKIRVRSKTSYPRGPEYLTFQYTKTSS